MEITIFTLTMTVIWVSIFIKIISLLRNQMSFLKYFSIYPLLILLVLCILRVLFPVELPFTVTINSYIILPPIQHFLCTPFVHPLDVEISLYHIIIAFWIGGSIITIIKHTRRYYRFSHIINLLPASQDVHLYDILDKASAGNTKHIEIKVHSSFQSPAVFGFIHPVILLPDMAFNDDQLLGIFIHELSHYRLKHQIVKLISAFIRICFWWNPLFRTLSSEVSHALEMHSDKAVCSILNQEQQKEYLLGIIKVLKSPNALESASPYCCNLVEEEDDEKLKQRFQMILEHNYQNSNKFHLITISLIFIVFLLSYSFVFQPYSEPNPEDYGSSTEIMDGNLYFFVEVEQGYDLYESSGQFIMNVDNVTDPCFKGVKVYKNLEDAK